ncbi:MAG: phospholipid carrier-dependent glycosyltransferase [Fuerstiella sp.]|nr:phospholipid carrier-dependent glycosyltransferase [Fuerstiella sp.]
MSDKHKPRSPAEDCGSQQRWRSAVPAVLFVALILRIGAASWTELSVREAGRMFFVEGDANGYWHLGRAVASGEDYSIHQPARRVLRVPGFPLLLGAVIHCFGESVFAARIILAGVGAGCCWLTYCLGCQLVTRRVGFWAALLMAVHPLQIGNSVLILSENWFTFWMLAGLWCLASQIGCSLGQSNEDSAFRLPLLIRSALTGALIAVAVLVRPGFILWLPVAMMAVVLLTRHRWPEKLILPVLMVIAFAAVMLPWVVRNYNVTGHWVLTSLWSGPSLYDGLNPAADGSSNMQFFDRDNVMATMSEYQMNAHYQQLAQQFMRENPGRTLTLAGRKLVRYLQPVPNSVSAGWVVWVACSLFWLIVVALCVAGLRARQLNPTGLLLVLGPFVLFMVVHMVFVGSLRYRLPAEFPLAILVATGMCQWLPRRKHG